AILAASGYAIGTTSATAAATIPDNGTDDGTTDGTGSASNPNVPTTGYNSDGSLTGSAITSDTSTWPGAQAAYPNAAVWDICTAVALAEGYNQGSGVAPYNLNNPGDLSPGDEQGQAVAGPPENHDGSLIIDFATVEGGFIALYVKFFNIVSGNSKVYPKTLTWTQVANIYAGDSGDWLNNVTGYLGVQPSSTPAQYAGLA
ncbi:MAG TPA: hypothetical protein VKJ65_00860, partial [Phycisphaerae bacterium]|nr:hypothetical protein [Phycisphaerae bacterium]